MPQITQHRLDFIAKTAATGMPVAQIAEAAGVSQGLVRKLVAGGHNEQFDQLLQGWKDKYFQFQVDHSWRLQAFSPAAYQAVGDTLSNTQEPRLRFEAAKWLLDRATNHEEKTKADMNLNVGFQANLAAGEVNVAAGEVSSTLKDILGALQANREAAGPDPHEATGDAALPGSFKVVAEAEKHGSKAFSGGNGSSPKELPEGTPIPTEDLQDD